ncbi:MAG: DNA repair protein RecN [Planctomycetota bacterium]
MLAELRVENLLLIASVHIELGPGLNVFTGETGAGKTLLLDALDFLLGARGDAALVRQGAAQAEVAARFIISDPELAAALAQDLGLVFEDLPAGGAPEAARGPGNGVELVLSRTLPRSGRARGHANGRPLALATLKELAERLVDIHGQHENQSLLRPATRLEVLDRFAAAQAERAEVRRAYAAALAAARALAELRRAARERQGREDMLRFQLKELADAQLEHLEPEALEGEVRLLRGAEKVRAAALAAGAALDGEEAENAAALLARAARNFSALGDAGPEAAALRQRLDALLLEIRAAGADAAALAEKAQSNPERLAELEERRNRLRALERKYGRDLAGLRALREKLAAELAGLAQLEVRTEQCENELAEAGGVLRAACQKLSRKRKAAARELEKQVAAELSGLGLKGARLLLVLAPHPEHLPPAEAEELALLPAGLKASGAEDAEILFSANPGLPSRPLQECASGGEISRVMLALKGVLARVSGADRLPVVVFDEVDAGVGGRLGAVLGRKLRALGRVRQVLCVTHQPQIAAYGQRQLKVEKTQSGGAAAIRVQCLEGERRIEELATMLRGAAASAHTRAEAAAMLLEAEEGAQAEMR